MVGWWIGAWTTFVWHHPYSPMAVAACAELAILAAQARGVRRLSGPARLGGLCLRWSAFGLLLANLAVLPLLRGVESGLLLVPVLLALGLGLAGASVAIPAGAILLALGFGLKQAAR